MRGSYGQDVPTQNAGLVFSGAIDIRLLIACPFDERLARRICIERRSSSQRRTRRELA